MERIQCSIAPKSPKVSNCPYSVMSASYLGIFFSTLFKVKYLKKYFYYYKKNTNSLNALQQHPEA